VPDQTQRFPSAIADCPLKSSFKAGVANAHVGPSPCTTAIRVQITGKIARKLSQLRTQTALLRACARICPEIQPAPFFRALGFIVGVRTTGLLRIALRAPLTSQFLSITIKRMFHGMAGILSQASEPFRCAWFPEAVTYVFL